MLINGGMHMSAYIDKQKVKNTSLIKSGFFEDDPGNGTYRNGKSYPFMLRDCRKNLHHSIRSDAIEYFDRYKIKWHSMEHTVNSQVACVNHLFPIRRNKEAVLNILKTISPDFNDVLSVEDTEDYIQFEAVGGNVNLLNEGCNLRGKYNTAVDALIFAVDKNNKRVLIPFEWKYAESYGKKECFTDAKKSGNSGKTSGEVRQDRYYDLIEKCTRLKTDESKKYGNYEPFYQLLRQTLWADQVRQKASDFIADDFIHVHVIPDGNTTLLNKGLSGMNMTDTWKSCLTEPDKYIVISPKELWREQSNDTELFNYLEKRYWT